MKFPNIRQITIKSLLCLSTMQYFKKIPFIVWLRWLNRTNKLLRANRTKHLKIGYLSYISDTKLGNFITIYDKVILHNCTLKNYVYIQHGGVITNASIGSFCSIGPNVRINPGNHPIHFVSTFPAFYSTRKQCQITFAKENIFDESGKVTIGNDVWIGANAIILDNISVGDGAVIAAGAVVNKDVEPYTIVGGVPAKPIKKRFSDEEIKQLIGFKWWDKDLDWLQENYRLFHNKEAFFERIGNQEV